MRTRDAQPDQEVSTIGVDDHDETDAELDVARAELAEAEAEIRMAAARLRLAKAEARSRARAAGTPVGDDGNLPAGGLSTAPDAEPMDEPVADETPDAGHEDPAERSEPVQQDDGVEHSSGTADAAAGEAADGVDAIPPRSRSRRLVLTSTVVFLVVVTLVVVGGLLWQGSDDSDSRASLGPDIALRVDDVAVTEEQLAQRVQVLKVLYGLTVPTDQAELDVFRRETARSLAASIVIDQAARAQGLAVSVDDVDSALSRYIRSRYTGDQQGAFEQELADNGITEQDVRDEISRQLNGQQLFLKVTAGISVTNAQARAAYKADPSSWALPEQRQLRYIAVPDRASADRILAALRRGGDFAAIARRRSADASTRDNGGSLGLVTADQLDPTFATPAFRAARGSLFGPVETGQGWYVGQVQRIVPARSTYTALRSSIIDGLSSKQALSVWNDYVATATSQATITYAADFKPDAEASPSADVPTTAPGDVSSPAPGTGR
ncbi:hypothetical protein GCM10022215_15110 [Nocardioides fonticola]|uniref:PpiC domain-containing protein n=1 Tax=Nocardioides fonticola TaxID=450363 RepID=A0ABP7XGN4_9ACTN